MAWSIGYKKIQCYRKRIIVIAAEGEVTEPQYFQKLNSMSQTTVFFIVENLGNGSDPRNVLKRMKKYLHENPLGNNDEAWIVIDQDKWPADALECIDNWATQKKLHRALSIRRFEDWLKLHVEGDSMAEKKYRSFLTGQNKYVPDDFVTKDRVIGAMRKAKYRYVTTKSVGNVFEVLESFFKE